MRRFLWFILLALCLTGCAATETGSFGAPPEAVLTYEDEVLEEHYSDNDLFARHQRESRRALMAALVTALGQEVTPDDFAARAAFYVECYREVERLAAEEWKERFAGTGEGVDYYLKNTGQDLWEQGKRSISDIPAAVKEYLDSIIYLPGTKDVWDRSYIYGDAKVNLLTNDRFVLRYAALSEEPIFGKFWFADKRLHLRSEDGKYYLVLRDIGGSYRFEAEPSTALTGEAAIPDEALFEGVSQMERYPLEWLE